MIAAYALPRRVRRSGWRRGLAWLVLVAASVVVGMAVAVALQGTQFALAPVLGGGLGLLALLALAIARISAAVALGFVLLGVGQFAIDPSDVVFGVVLAVAAATGRLDLRRPPGLVVVFLGFLVILSLVSCVGVQSLRAAAVFLAITLYVAALSLWLPSWVDSSRRARTLVRGYLAGAVATAAWGLAALVAPVPGGETVLFQGERVRGLFDDPNVFAPYLVLPALLLLEELLSPRLLRLRRPITLALVLLLALALLFSYSRAAWLNLGLGIVILLAVLGLRRGGARKALSALAVVCVTALGLIGALAATDSFEFLRERAQVQSYDTERFAAQQFGIQEAFKYPLGIGPGQFDVVSPLSTHSTYVRVLAEQGMLGLVALVGVVVVTLLLAAGNAVAGRDTHGIGSATLLAAWCGIVANSFFIDTLHFRFLWVIAALIWIGALRRAP